MHQPDRGHPSRARRRAIPCLYRRGALRLHRAHRPHRPGGGLCGQADGTGGAEGTAATVQQAAARDHLLVRGHRGVQHLRAGDGAGGVRDAELGLQLAEGAHGGGGDHARRARLPVLEAAGGGGGQDQQGGDQHPQPGAGRAGAGPEPEERGRHQVHEQPQGGAHGAANGVQAHLQVPEVVQGDGQLVPGAGGLHDGRGPEAEPVDIEARVGRADAGLGRDEV
mmetsp:Transcript_35166/g.59259  ORF Transcript_35166/g.59259 Transcript_35166/m.59259 type:complete len:223 (+) Transcript_35166:781-1449(+)